MGDKDDLELRLEYKSSSVESGRKVIQEFDSEGNQIGSDWFRFVGDCCFRFENAKEFVSMSGKIDGWWEGRTDSANVPITSSEEEFRIDLKPYDEDSEIEYSIFGTTRKIDKFSLWVRHSRDEKCEVSAGPRGWVAQDYLEIELDLKVDRFRRLADAIVSEDIRDIFLQISTVPGFYSPWTMGTASSQIKILGDERTHPLPTFDQFEAGSQPLRCGRPLEYEIRWMSRSDIEKVDALSEAEKELDDIYDQKEAEKERLHEMGRIVAQKFGSRLNRIENLKVPLWIICGILVATFIF